MPQVDPAEFYKTLEKGEVTSRLFLLHGEEPFLLNQSLQILKGISLGDGLADFNLNIFHADDLNLEALIDTLQTLPVMAANRVVIVRGVQSLNEKAWDQLESFIVNPMEASVLILTADKLDKRKKSVKKIFENAITVEFRRPYENEMPGWVKYLAETYKLKLEDEAVVLLARLVGTQLTEVDQELSKLKNYVGERLKVTVEDVAATVSHSREESVFALTDAIADNDRVAALMQVVRLLDQGQNEIGVVSLIARHLRALMGILEGQKQGLSGPKLANSAGVPAYFLHKYVNQSRKWSMRRLEDAFLVLSDTDLALKSSPLSSHIWLENLIIRTCIPAESRA